MLLSSSVSFFKKLKKNNNRDWFAKNKSRFKELEFEVKVFGEEVKNRLNEFDNIDRFKLFRVYRDIRFSKDKTPFKTHFGLYWNRIKPHLRGGYYLHISPNNNFLACGFWDPNPKDLYRIRKEFLYNAQRFRNILKSNKIHSIWGELKGSQLKTAPRNFDKNHPNIDLIRKKQFIYKIHYSDKEVLDKKFVNRVEHSFKVIRPFLNYMTEILTTDENGESLF
tara:strand:+ start:102 stop:767 length:666 start_codon:yes stop_codon:yes gene_type:complete